jgi:cell division septation protein DedD
MPRNDEGEYELVLGTPQLLSVVFLLVVLLGVVFSAGYYLGRSTAGELPGVTAEGDKPAPASAGDRPKASGELAAQAPASEPSPPGGQPLEPGEVKLAPASSPESVAAPSAGPAAPGEVQTGQSKPPVAPAAAAAEPAPYPEPSPGQTFLQVAAVRRAEAELLVDVLKRKGFPALVAPGPSETLFRVLVGPLKDDDDIARTRNRLEEAGFRSSYVRKY